MKHSDENPLLKEILADEKMSALRHASLDQGLTALRRARQRRFALRAGMLALLPIALTIALLKHTDITTNRLAKAPVPSTDVATPAPIQEAEVKTISDDELFALFPDQSLALVGKPGQQQLVSLNTHQQPMVQ